MVPEYLEFLEVLQAKFVIGPLEVAINDVLRAPRPIISQLVILLNSQEEFLHTPLEVPERGAAQDVVVGTATAHEVKKAESVEGGVVAAQVASVLFVALPLMDVVILKVTMRDKISNGLRRDSDMGTGDIHQYFFENLVPELPHLLGHNRDHDFMHEMYII
jgi:hypothetical protein